LNINEFCKYIGVVIGTNYYTLATVWDISGCWYCDHSFQTLYWDVWYVSLRINSRPLLI